MNKNTNWSRGTTSSLEAFDKLINLFKHNHYGYIEKRPNDYEHLAFPILKTKKDYSVFDYEATYNSEELEIAKLNTIEYTLQNEYYPCFSTKKARDNYINKGIVHKDLFFGIGIQTPVKLSDLKELFPNKEFDSFMYKWHTNKPYTVIDDSVKECYCIVMTNDTFAKKNFYEEFYKNLIYVTNNPLKN